MYDIISAWLHNIWYRILRTYCELHYIILYWVSVVVISELWHIIWYCNSSIYLYIIMYYITYYVGLCGTLYGVICFHGTPWSSFLVVLWRIIIHFMPLFITCIIWYCIFHDFIMVYHWLVFVGILLHLIWYWSFSIRCDVILSCIPWYMGWCSIVFDIIAISLVIIHWDIRSYRMVL